MNEGEHSPKFHKKIDATHIIPPQKMEKDSPSPANLVGKQTDFRRYNKIAAFAKILSGYTLI